jgi:hypothetical protein
VGAEDNDDHEHGQKPLAESRSGVRVSKVADFAALDASASFNKFKAECTSCHQLYHPGLLPERSWVKMMNGLSQHFGENASLDEATKKEITAFLVSQSADRANGKRSQKIAKSLGLNETPLRVSETYYFKRKHHELSSSIFKRPRIASPANCIACHPGSEKGDFNEHAVKIPPDGPVVVKEKSPATSNAPVDSASGSVSGPTPGAK